MKPKTLINKILTYDDYIQVFFEKDWVGSCPCFYGFKTLEGKKLYVRGLCWRVSKNAQDLYVWGEVDNLKDIGEAIKKRLDRQKWYNPYTLILRKETI
jgi:hypothetical protein